MDAADVISEIRWRVPFFQPTPEWVEDNLTYPVIGDLALYICACQQQGIYDEMQQGLNCLEFILGSGYSDAHSLVLDCLEGLRECASHSEIRAELPSELSKLWAAYIRD